MKCILIICFLIGTLPLVNIDQNKAKTRSKSVKPTPTPPESHISIEAGLVYQSGDVKPVARTTFYLLDMDFGQALFEAGLKSPADARPTTTRTDQEQLVNSFGMISLGLADLSANYSFLKAGEKCLASHLVKDVTTDFAGKASFEPVKPGIYYLVGLVKTRKAFAIWNLKVDAKPGPVTLVLDQKNANYAE